MRSAALALTCLLVLAAAASAATLEATIPVDRGPLGIAIDSARGRAYVANGTAPGSVYAIDLATNSVVASTPTIWGAPGWVVVDSPRGRVFVADFDNGNVVVLDADTLETVTTLAPGGLGLAIDPSRGLLYATAASYLAVFDLATLATVAVVPAEAGMSWWGVAVDAATQRLYLQDLWGQRLVVLDAVTLGPVATVALEAESRFGVTVDPARGLVYVPRYAASGAVQVIDATTNVVIAVTPVGGFPFTLLLDGDRLYSADLASGTVSVLAAGREPAVVETIALGGAPAGLALAGQRLYVTDNANDSVSVVSLAPPNAAPVVDGVEVSPAAPFTNDTLSAVVTAHDDDGDALTSAYQWTRNGTDIPGATSATLDLSVPGNGDRGDAIAVRVTVHDGRTASTPVTSTAVIIRNSAPAAVVSLSTRYPTVRDVLVATTSASDADGDAITLTYVWRVDGAVVRTTTTTAATDSFDLRRGAAHVGDAVTVTVTPSDGMMEGADSADRAWVRPGP